MISKRSLSSRNRSSGKDQLANKSIHTTETTTYTHITSVLRRLSVHHSTLSVYVLSKALPKNPSLPLSRCDACREVSKEQRMCVSQSTYPSIAPIETRTSQYSSTLPPPINPHRIPPRHTTGYEQRHRQSVSTSTRKRSKAYARSVCTSDPARYSINL